LKIFFNSFLTHISQNMVTYKELLKALCKPHGLERAVAILIAIIYLFWASSIVPVITFSFLYYLIVCYYCKIRFKSFNDYLNSLKDAKIRAFINYKTVDQLIKDRNSICSDTKNYNKFWQKYYFALTYTLISINLLTL
jgi:ABC-type transport system involved in Fe-S cluster assembly fused permease/ATPase subunit